MKSTLLNKSFFKVKLGVSSVVIALIATALWSLGAQETAQARVVATVGNQTDQPACPQPCDPAVPIPLAIQTKVDEIVTSVDRKTYCVLPDPAKFEEGRVHTCEATHGDYGPLGELVSFASYYVVQGQWVVSWVRLHLLKGNVELEQNGTEIACGDCRYIRDELMIFEQNQFVAEKSSEVVKEENYKLMGVDRVEGFEVTELPRIVKTGSGCTKIPASEIRSKLGFSEFAQRPLDYARAKIQQGEKSGERVEIDQPSRSAEFVQETHDLGYTQAGNSCTAKVVSKECSDAATRENVPVDGNYVYPLKAYAFERVCSGDPEILDFIPQRFQPRGDHLDLFSKTGREKTDGAFIGKFRKNPPKSPR